MFVLFLYLYVSLIDIALLWNILRDELGIYQIYALVIILNEGPCCAS